MSKKNLLIISSCITFLMFVANYVGTYWICDNVFSSLGGSIGHCPDILADGMTVFFPVIPLFLISLITYKMRDEVYRMWVRFSYVWILFSMIAIFFAPAYSGDWMYPIDKSSIAFLASVLFIVISLAIIAWKYIAIRKIR